MKNINKEFTIQVFVTYSEFIITIKSAQIPERIFHLE